MRGCLTDQSGDLNRGFPAAIEVATARRQRGLMQIEGLPVVPEIALVQSCLVEPRLIRSGWTRAEVDLGPPGNGRGARDVSRSVVHERYQVGPRGLGAPRRTQSRDVTVGEISRKIGGQILEPDAQAEARIGLAPGGRGGNQEKRAQHRARADATHSSNHLSCNCQGAESARNNFARVPDNAFTATSGGLTARYTVLQSCAALDSSASAAAAPNGATR